ENLSSNPSLLEKETDDEFIEGLLYRVDLEDKRVVGNLMWKHVIYLI
ncbi:15634_t:CDS:2, partial [Cetraspora pellucida]